MTPIDTTEPAMRTRAARIRMALDEIGDNSLVTVRYDEDDDKWNIIFDPNPMTRKAIALVLIHEGRPDLVACEECAQTARAYIEAAETCHHLDWTSTKT